MRSQREIENTLSLIRTEIQHSVSEAQEANKEGNLKHLVGRLEALYNAVGVMIDTNRKQPEGQPETSPAVFEQQITDALTQAVEQTTETVPHVESGTEVPVQNITLTPRS